MLGFEKLVLFVLTFVFVAFKLSLKIEKLSHQLILQLNKTFLCKPNVTCSTLVKALRKGDPAARKIEGAVLFYFLY